LKRFLILLSWFNALPDRRALAYIALSMFERKEPSSTPGGAGVRVMRGTALLMLLALALGSTGCATIRITDPGRTATEQFLMSVALVEAIDELSSNALRDREVFIDNTYLRGLPEQEVSFLLGEVRSRMLLAGVRLVDEKAKAQIVVEPRSGGVGIDRTEFLLGIPAIYVSGAVAASGGAAAAPPITTPELAIIKRTTQKGFASVAFVAYWRDTGELVGSSGPAIGRTLRQDYWFFGTGPRTIGDIPTTENPR
jgi:hypothetical protein